MMQCTTTGGPGNIIRWFREGELLLADDSDDLSIENITEFESVLMVYNISAMEGGEYSCNVSNTAGSDQTSMFINIAPYFTSQPLDEGGVNESMVVLICGVEAVPEPQVQWFAVEEDVRSELVTNSSVLVFDPLLFGDEGQYYCNASSSGVTIQSDTVTVTGKLSNTIQ